MLAAVAMAMSSVTVLGNSILLGRYKPKLLATKAEREETDLYRNRNEKEPYLLMR